MPFCSNCGKEVAEGSAFCSQCGQRLTGFTPEETQEYIKELEAAAGNENEPRKDVIQSAWMAKRKYAIDDRSQLHKDANKSLDQNLSPGEKVKVIILGLWDSAVIGTEKRCFVYKRGLMGGTIFGSNLTSWDYLNLNGVQIETGPMSGFVSLQGPGIISKDKSYWNIGDTGPARSPFAISIN